MFQKVLACLDGSPLSEKILPLAHALTTPKAGKLTLLRIVSEASALEDDYMRDYARQYGAALRFLVSTDPAAAIVAEDGQSLNSPLGIIMICCAIGLVDIRRRHEHALWANLGISLVAIGIVFASIATIAEGALFFVRPGQ